jgi:hypothetical protein
MYSSMYRSQQFSFSVHCEHSAEKQTGHHVASCLRRLQKSATQHAWGFFHADKGVCAEVRVGREHLRLFSEQNALGVQVSVYNVNAKKWIAPSESAETIEQGKLKAATYAETYLRQVANLELPPLQWKESRAA